MNERIKELTDKIVALKKEMQEEGKVVLKESFKEFFDKYPAIHCVTWTQYTPYFNDGDECTFSVGDFWVMDKASFDEWQEEGGGYAEEFDVLSSYSDRPFEGMTEKEIESAREELKAISSLPDDIFLDLFDNHVYITATRNGFDVEEYNHD